VGLPPEVIAVIPAKSGIQPINLPPALRNTRIPGFRTGKSVVEHYFVLDFRLRGIGIVISEDSVSSVAFLLFFPSLRETGF
jgi:hypothetical protein